MDAVYEVGHFADVAFELDFPSSRGDARLWGEVAKIADELRIREYQRVDVAGDLSGPSHPQEPVVSRVDRVRRWGRDLLGVGTGGGVWERFERGEELTGRGVRRAEDL
ncbi:MAG: hypothetical protein M3Q30_23505 [Actinomycetota bacterium]|nr:hypothetical protein [Actinomycetota bacterium]